MPDPDRVSLVVGGTRGIGLACATALAENGDAVVVTGRNEQNAVEAASGLAERHGVQALGIAWDIADVEEARPVIARIVEEFGRLDAAIVNAGINPYWLKTEDVTPEIWDDLMATNLRGNFFAIQAAAEPMLASGEGGAILAVSSMTATAGVLRGMPYVPGKGALDAMVRSLAVEWAGRNVRINGIAPGFVATDLTAGIQENDRLRDDLIAQVPMGRFAEPAEIGEVAALLVSPPSSYLTGQVIQVDGGYTAK